MKSIFTLTGALVAIAAVGTVFYAGYLAIVYLWHVYAELDTVVRIILLSIMVTLMIAALIISGAIKTVGLTASKGLSGAKLQLYKSMVEAYKPYFSYLGQPSQQCCSEVLTRLTEFEAEAQILSAGDVLGIHRKLESALRNGDERDQVDKLFQNLIKSIRRDLGHAPSHIESKLSFLVQTTRLEKPDRTGPDVSV